jgi:hypothetical protein
LTGHDMSVNCPSPLPSQKSIDKLFKFFKGVKAQ